MSPVHRQTTLACLIIYCLLVSSVFSVCSVNAQPLNQQSEEPPNDRLYIQQNGILEISTAVPSADETRNIFGSDLYSRNVQPVWIKVVNQGENTLYLTPLGLDPNYFTARETAHRSRDVDGAPLEEIYEQKGLISFEIGPGQTQSGYIFSRVDEGTKSFNVDIVGDGQPRRISFFVPVPGLKLDHYEVDIKGMYPDNEIRELELREMVAELERMPCCVRDADGKDKGDPLNLILVGEIDDIYYGFMRSGWDETETIHSKSLWKTATSAVSGELYRYSPVSALYVFDRPQDAAMQRARSSIHERNHLRIWLTPLRYKNTPVWIGQISRDIGVHFTRRTITTHKIDPDVDETREYLLENLAYAESIKRFGYIGGVGPASYEQPRGNLTGDPYFTDGRRIVLWFSEEPNTIDEIEYVDLTPYLTGVIGN